MYAYIYSSNTHTRVLQIESFRSLSFASPSPPPPPGMVWQHQALRGEYYPLCPLPLQYATGLCGVVVCHIILANRLYGFITGIIHKTVEGGGGGQATIMGTRYRSLPPPSPIPIYPDTDYQGKFVKKKQNILTKALILKDGQKRFFLHKCTFGLFFTEEEWATGRPLYRIKSI